MSMTISGVGRGSSMAMSGASMRLPPQQKMTNLYNKIDTSGSGAISQAQFNQAFSSLNPPAAFQKAGNQAVWGQLDPSGSGSVSQADFVNGMKSLMVSLRAGTNDVNSLKG
jgi:Ca2+-binding EF-hand superfamily protein